MKYNTVYDNVKREDLFQVIEALIDRHTLKNIMYDLINVCYAKSEHLEENWQDTRQSKIWLKIAKALDRICRTTNIPNYI